LSYAQSSDRAGDKSVSNKMIVGGKIDEEGLGKDRRKQQLVLVKRERIFNIRN